MSRPERPSAQLAARKKEAAALLIGTGETVRLIIEIPRHVRHAAKARAFSIGKSSLRAYIMSLLAADGVKGIDPADLE